MHDDKKKFVKSLLTDGNLPKFDDEPIRQLLGDRMPILARSSVGRIRLLRALKMHFGESYHTFEGAKKVIDHFDNEVDHLIKYIKIKRGTSNG